MIYDPNFKDVTRPIEISQGFQSTTVCNEKATSCFPTEATCSRV